MKMFASLHEIVSIFFRKNSREIELKPSTSVTYTAARAVELPPQDADSVLVSENATQALSNKTIDGDSNTLQAIHVSSLQTVLGNANKAIVFDGAGSPTTALVGDSNLNTGISAAKIGSGTVDNTEFGYLNGAGSSILGKDDSGTFTNKKLSDATTFIVDSTDATKRITFSANTAPSVTTTIESSASSSNTVVLPNATTTLVGQDTSDLLQNKSLQDSTCFIVDESNNTKKIAFQASGISASTTRTITMPDADVNLGSLTNSNISASAAIVDTKLATISTAGKVSNSATTATDLNTASAIVARDASGNFSAGTITASLTGNASGTAANVTGIVAPDHGGTGVANNAAATLTRSGNHALTLTTTNTTSLTLPTSGTVATTSNNLGDFAATTSLQLKNNISDETGSGALVFGTQPTLDRPVVNQADMTQAASATTPASGKSAIYVNSGDAKLHIVDSSGTDTAIGSGGAGSRNYLSDWFDGVKSVGTVTNSITATGNITISTTAWQASDTSKLTVANVTSAGLRGDAMTNANHKCLKLDHIAVGVAFVQSPVFQLDPVDQGKPVTVSFDHGAVTTADDFQVYMVRYNSSGTYQEQIVIAGTASATSPYSARMAAGSTTTFRGFFIAGSTGTDYYALRFYRNNASDTTDINIDTLYVGPQSVTQGAAVTDWQAISTTGWSIIGASNGLVYTNTTITSIKTKQVGQNIQFYVFIDFSGAPATGSGAFLIQLPATYTVDTSQLGNGDWPAGTIKAKIAGLHYDGECSYNGLNGSNSTFILNYNGGRFGTTTPGTVASGDYLYAKIDVPIVGKTSNVTMADRAVEEYAYNTSTWDSEDIGTSNFGYGAQGALGGTTALTILRNKRVRFQTPILPTDKLFLEVSTDRVNWVPPGGNWTNSGLVEQLRYDGTNYIGMGLYNSYYSVQTDTLASFGKYLYGTTGAYNGTWYWRVRKVSGGAAVGYPVSARNVVGDISGQTVPSGYIGQRIDGSAIAASLTVNTSSTTASTLDLTPGVWSIKFYVSAGYTTGASSGNGGYVYARIRDSGDTTTYGTPALLQCKTVAAVANYVETTICGEATINISTATTYKLIALRVDSSGTGSANIYNGAAEGAQFFAIRIA